MESVFKQKMKIKSGKRFKQFLGKRFKHLLNLLMPIKATEGRFWQIGLRKVRTF